MQAEVDITPERINPDTAPLWKIMSEEFYDHPRRVLQIMDPETDAKRREWYREYFATKYGELRQMTVGELWQELGVKEPFKKKQWTYFEKFFGTADMYADPDHQACIHGDDHMDRVTLFAYILGQYKGLSEEEMKVLLVAASVHDKARRDDRVAPNHGKDAADNFDSKLQHSVVKNGIATERVVPAYIKIFHDRGFSFSDKEINQIKLLCEYHEKPWKDVPEAVDESTRLLIQVMQVADAADRFRSPSPEWWPDPRYFDEFFKDEKVGLVNERAQEAFLHFAACFTLLSEKERFEKSMPAKEAIKQQAQAVGLVADQDAEDQVARALFFGYRRVGVGVR